MWGVKAFGWTRLYIPTLFKLSIMSVCILHTSDAHPIAESMSCRWASTQHQQLRGWHIHQWKGCIVMSIQRGSTPWLYSSKWKRHSPCPILEMTVNSASTNFGSCIMSCLWSVQWYLPLVTVLAAVMGKHASSNVATTSWRSSSMERQCFCVMHLGYSTSYAVVSSHTKSIGSMYEQKC
jgi:hypothetical protein